MKSIVTCPVCGEPVLFEYGDKKYLHVTYLFQNNSLGKFCAECFAPIDTHTEDSLPFLPFYVSWDYFAENTRPIGEFSYQGCTIRYFFNFTGSVVYTKFCNAKSSDWNYLEKSDTIRGQHKIAVDAPLDVSALNKNAKEFVDYLVGRFNDSYDVLSDILDQKKVEEDHAGMVQNPMTGEWSWL